jgi:hypothetical protein
MSGRRVGRSQPASLEPLDLDDDVTALDLGKRDHAVFMQSQAGGRVDALVGGDAQAKRHSRVEQLGTFNALT